MADMLEPEFAEPYQQWKAAPGPKTSGAVLRAVDPILKSALKTYTGSSNNPILYSRARRITLDSLAGYDPGKAKLRTHLLSRLQGLRRAQTQLNQTISIPEQIQLDQHHLYEAENRLRDWLGRDPSDDELADETGLSLRRLRHVRKAKSAVPESVMTTNTEDGEDIYQPAVQAANDQSGWYEFVYHSLHPVDKLILEHSAGLHGKPVLSSLEMSRRLGITPSAVSQRKARIQQQLNRQQHLRVL